MEKFAIAYCSTCKTKNPIDFQDMVKGKSKNKITATIAWCVVCEYVLNLENDKKIEWVTEKWLEKHGWSLSKKEL